MEATTMATETRQYLTFTLGEEVFALDISQVREVLDYRKVTKVPRTPDFMRGVINLRGSVVPVVDMRLRYGMSRTEETVKTCIIITEVAIGGENIVFGALADSVREVIELEPGQIEPAPKLGMHINTEFIKGIGKSGEDFLIILDIDRAFSTEEVALIGQSGIDAQATEA